MLTRRQLNRLIVLSAEAGARFAGEGSSEDGAAWMYAPRRLFGGASATEACRDREPFLHAMLLHGMGAAPDLDPGEMNDLIDLGWAALVEGEKRASRDAVRSCGRRASLSDFGMGHPQLYTAAVASDGAEGCVHAFVAFLAVDEEDAQLRLRKRLGPLAAQASLRQGFDPSEPIAASLLSDAVADILKDVSVDRQSALGRGLDVFFQHGFAN